MLAAQERMTSVLYPRQLGTLRVQERERTRQARVRLDSAVEIVDRGSVAFGWVLTVKAPDPRRTAVRPIYLEVAVPVLPGSASGEVFLAGDYPWIPARIQVWGPIKDFTITHEQTGLVIDPVEAWRELARGLEVQPRHRPGHAAGVGVRASGCVAGASAGAGHARLVPGAVRAAERAEHHRVGRSAGGGPDGDAAHGGPGVGRMAVTGSGKPSGLPRATSVIMSW
ncbi:hypothetical protein [Nonomuraea dietziae]|uniref:hypothetical protein n=1 Tax=Nonomuraea dietziae TaxID=65515 RepID=UPI0034055369